MLTTPKRRVACHSDFVIAILATAGFYCLATIRPSKP